MRGGACPNFTSEYGLEPASSDVRASTLARRPCSATGRARCQEFTLHLPQQSEPHKKGKMSGFDWEGEAGREGGETGQQVWNMDAQQGEQSWLGVPACRGHRATSPSASTSVPGCLLGCCATSAQPLNLSDHCFAQKVQQCCAFPPTLPD